jgi:hypothetical protein
VWTTHVVTARGSHTQDHEVHNLAEALVFELRKSHDVLYMHVVEPDGTVGYQYVHHANSPGGVLEVGRPK